MSKITLHKDFLIDELDLPSSAIKNDIIGTSRWSIQHEIIFLHNDKYWKTYYQVGATESQDEGPWEYDSDVDCVEVELVEKLVKVWQEV